MTLLGLVPATTSEMKGLARDLMSMGWNAVFAVSVDDRRWAVWVYEVAS